MGKLRLKDLSNHDRGEVSLFKKYIKRLHAVSSDTRPTYEQQQRIYAEIYGEVVFDTPLPAPKDVK